jgi:hypothetical protein
MVNQFLISSFYQEGNAKAETKKARKSAKKIPGQQQPFEAILIASFENLLALHSLVIWSYRTIFREWYVTSLPVTDSISAQYQIIEQPKRILKCIHEILLPASSMKNYSLMNSNKISLSTAIHNYFFPNDLSMESFSIFTFLELFFALEKKLIELNSVPCFEYYGYGSFLSFLTEHFFSKAPSAVVVSVEDPATTDGDRIHQEADRKREKPHVVAELLQTIDKVLQTKVKSSLETHTDALHFHSQIHSNQQQASSGPPLLRRARSFDEERVMKEFTTFAMQNIETMYESMGMSENDLIVMDAPQIQDQLEFLARLEFRLMQEFINLPDFQFLFQGDHQHS